MSSCQCGETPDPGCCGQECPLTKFRGSHGCACQHWPTNSIPLPRQSAWNEAILPSARREPITPTGIHLGDYTPSKTGSPRWDLVTDAAGFDVLSEF